MNLKNAIPPRCHRDPILDEKLINSISSPIYEVSNYRSDNHKTIFVKTLMS